MVLLKNKEVVVMHNTIGQVATKDVGKIKFKWGIARNQKILQKEFEILEDFRKPSPDFEKYEAKRQEVVQKFADVDDKGQYVIDDRLSQFVVSPGKRDDLERTLKPLRDEYKEILEAREKQIKDFKELLEQEIELDFYKINFNNIPEELLAAEMSALMPIWDEEEDNVTDISTKTKKSARKKTKSS